MKWICFSLLAAFALFGSACERHTAAETASALAGEGHSAEEGAKHTNASGETGSGPAAHNTVEMPKNPAGSGPVNEHPAARHTDGADLHKDTPKLLPESK